MQQKSTVENNNKKQQHSQVQQKIKTKGKAEEKTTKQSDKKIALISPTHTVPDYPKPIERDLLVWQVATQTSDTNQDVTFPEKFANE